MLHFLGLFVLDQLLDKSRVCLQVKPLVVDVRQWIWVVTQPVKQVVRWVGHNAVRLRWWAARVIEAVPLPVDRILPKCRVVATASASVVVWNRVQVVDKFGIFLLLFTQNERTHVKVLKWEVNQGVHFLAREKWLKSFLEPAAFESLERDDHNTRKLKDFHTLYCLNVGLTFVAVPHVVLIERLLLLEGPKTVVNVNRVRVLTFIPPFLCT